LVVVPLVGFDARCHRLGMGGGWYDRSFAFRHGQAPPPRLVGAGFAFQQSAGELDRKSTRLNSSHVKISYAVFCLKKKKLTKQIAETFQRSSRRRPKPPDGTTRTPGVHTPGQVLSMKCTDDQRPASMIRRDTTYIR